MEFDINLPPIGFIIHDQVVEVDEHGNVGDYDLPAQDDTSHSTDSTHINDTTSTNSDNTSDPSSDDISQPSHNPNIRIKYSKEPPRPRPGQQPRKKKRNRRKLWRENKKKRDTTDDNDKTNWRTKRQQEREQAFVPLQQGGIDHDNEGIPPQTDSDVPTLQKRVDSSSSEDEDKDEEQNRHRKLRQTRLKVTATAKRNAAPPEQISQKQKQRHPLRQLTLAQARLAKDLLPSHPDGIFGDGVTEIDDDYFRVYFQNVNGLSTADGGLDTAHTLMALKRKQVGLYGLAESNQDFQKSKL